MLFGLSAPLTDRNHSGRVPKTAKFLQSRVYRSLDGGVSFQVVSDGSVKWQKIALSFDGSVLLATAATANQPDAIYVSIDFGTNFVASGPSGKWVALKAGQYGQHLYAIAAMGGLYMAKLPSS